MNGTPAVCFALLSRDLHRMNGAMYDSRTEWVFPQVDSAAADSGTVELDDLIFRRLSLPLEEVSAGRDGNYGSLKIDSATVDYGTGVVGLDDLIFRGTNLPPDEFSAGRNGDYIWRDLWTGPSVCNRPVTGSHGFGSSQRLGRRSLWLAGYAVRLQDTVFFHQYVADLRDERSENVVLIMSALKDSQPEGENYVLQSAIRKEKSEKVLRTFATSPVIFDIASCRTSGVIAAPPESSAGAAQPLNTGVNILYDVNTGSLSVIPPDLGIKRPVMQPQNLTISRMSESRPSLSLPYTLFELQNFSLLTMLKQSSPI